MCWPGCLCRTGASGSGSLPEARPAGRPFFAAWPELLAAEEKAWSYVNGAVTPDGWRALVPAFAPTLESLLTTSCGAAGARLETLDLRGAGPADTGLRASHVLSALREGGCSRLVTLHSPWPECYVGDLGQHSMLYESNLVFRGSDLEALKLLCPRFEGGEIHLGVALPEERDARDAFHNFDDVCAALEAASRGPLHVVLVDQRGEPESYAEDAPFVRFLAALSISAAVASLHVHSVDFCHFANGAPFSDLIAAAVRSSSLATLAFYSCNLDTNLTRLARMLRRNELPSVSRLVLDNTTYTPLHMLARMLRTNTSLTSLDLNVVGARCTNKKLDLAGSSWF